MYIVSRFWKLSLFQLTLFVVLYLWLRARYGERAWFGKFRWFFAAAAVGFQLVFWSYLWIGREQWIMPGANHWPGEYLLWVLLAWVLQSFVLLPLLFAAHAVRMIALRWKARPAKSAAGNQPSAAHDADQAGISRRGFLTRAGALAGLAVDVAPGIGMAGVFSGMFLGSREIITTENKISLRELHADFAGARIVQISDIHAGSVINELYLKYVVGLLKATRGDILVVTGDLIDFHNRYLNDIGRFLNQAAAHFPLGVYVIPGNHDYFYDGLAMKSILQKGDFNLLLNEHRIVARGKGRLEIVGLDYPWPFYPGMRTRRSARSREYFQMALKSSVADAPRILLNHDPTEFAWVRAGQGPTRVDLMLSGHTHGGQIHIPGPGGGQWIPVEALYPYVDGHYRSHDSQLYVNRGLGHALPLRIDCPPEISVFELS